MDKLVEFRMPWVTSLTSYTTESMCGCMTDPLAHRSADRGEEHTMEYQDVGQLQCELSHRSSSLKPTAEIGGGAVNHAPDSFCLQANSLALDFCSLLRRRLLKVASITGKSQHLSFAALSSVGGGSVDSFCYIVMASCCSECIDA